MKKKIISIFLAGVLVCSALSMTGCGQKDGEKKVLLFSAMESIWTRMY